MQNHKSETTRCEIQDLYFWLGEEAERVGFTPWQTAWLGDLLPPGWILSGPIPTEGWRFEMDVREPSK